MKTLVFVIASLFNVVTPNANESVQAAQFPGGIEGLSNFVADQLVYPIEARKNAVEGTVKVAFEISPDGTVQNAEVVASLGSGCDEAALNVVNAMPDWEPATRNGEKVMTKAIIPITFQLAI